MGSNPSAMVGPARSTTGRKQTTVRVPSVKNEGELVDAETTFGKLKITMPDLSGVVLSADRRSAEFQMDAFAAEQLVKSQRVQEVYTYRTGATPSPPRAQVAPPALMPQLTDETRARLAAHEHARAGASSAAAVTGTAWLGVRTDRWGFSTPSNTAYPDRGWGAEIQPWEGKWRDLTNSFYGGATHTLTSNEWKDVVASSDGGSTFSLACSDSIVKMSETQHHRHHHQTYRYSFDTKGMTSSTPTIQVFDDGPPGLQRRWTLTRLQFAPLTDGAPLPLLPPSGTRGGPPVLSDQAMDAMDFEKLNKALLERGLPTIGTLEEGDKRVSALGRQVAKNELTQLNLSNNKLGPGGGEALATVLRGYCALQTLTLCENALGDRGVHAILTTIALPELRELNLIGNGITPKGARAVAGCLKALPSLGALNLSKNNQLGDEGAEAIAVGLKEGANNQNEHLRHLYLYETGITDKGAQALAGCLAACKSLEMLNLECNKLSEQGRRTLQEAVAGRSGFKLYAQQSLKEKLEQPTLQVSILQLA